VATCVCRNFDSVSSGLNVYEEVTNTSEKLNYHSKITLLIQRAHTHVD